MNQHQVPLAATWSQITALLAEGYSLIPVRDKPDERGPAKSPYTGWKYYQEHIISAKDLWTQMADRFNTTAVAVVCGKVSGNFEAIDVDVKYKPGIDAQLFKDIQTIYPDLWTRLRIHRSPSGGYHIPYRIIDGPPEGNKKLASRPTTATDNLKSKQVSFIETRGEGGIILLPPSAGYTVFKAAPIPYLKQTERDALIALCVGYNEVIKVAPEKRPTKAEDTYYDENPFAHFNRSAEGRNVLVDNGWTPNREGARFAWFMRPGSKSMERHATYIKDKQLFWFWTTNEQFDSNRCYSPSTVLAILAHNGDFKATYRALVSRGFGRIKQAKEAKLVLTGTTPPANLSATALAAYTARKASLAAVHPYGLFWAIEPDPQRALIDREALYKISGALGFRLHAGELYRVDTLGFVTKVDERTYFDCVAAYIQEPDPELWRLVINTFEHFLQVAGKFTVSRLPLLDVSLLLEDTRTTAYKFFSDCWVRITATTVESYTYEELNGKLVWGTRVLNRPFNMQEGGRYQDFLERAVEFTRIRTHILKVIGYLAHEYKDETTAYIITLTEQCPDPRQGGGSGKNLFCNLFKNITTLTTRPGEQIKYDEKFFQTWNGEKVFVVSDVPRDFNFLFLKEITSGNAVLKKLWQNEREVLVHELPKIIVNTNYSYEITDGGLKRRIIPIEFTNFFTRNGGVRSFYNCFFPLDWDSLDWAGFDYLMVTGIQTWLAGGLTLAAPTLTEGGWRKQFEQTYGIYTAEFIYEHWATWLAAGFVPNPEFKKQLNDYMEERSVARMYHPSTIKVNKGVEEYGLRMGVAVVLDAQKKINGINYKGKQFGDEDPTPF